MSAPLKIRCAIYTRKSSEEGLEQAFNSLDAQREACAAYVTSQKHEGWVLLKDHYDDGGISGGTLERPAVQRLLADIDAGRVDRVVVYKVDRLTRSLADFAKLVDRFDAAGASFVSVTQSFNTATSMGRLTLNVLLSFAQFEREVTAERIRDKIAASKKKGMWMGGNVPLGYDAKERSLTINEAEAKTVRALFDLYLEHADVRSVAEAANRLGLLTKRLVGPNGTARGGASMSRGQIHYALTNPVYVGRIRHREKTYEGRHDPIIDEATWDAVQARLTDHAARPRGRSVSKAVASTSPSPLAGKLVDETGDRLTPSHASKAGTRYRYYVSNRLIAKSGERDQSGWRLPAAALEQAVAQAIASHLKAPDFALRLLGQPTVAEVETIGQEALRLADELNRDDGAALIARLVRSGRIAPDELALELDATALAERLLVPAHRIEAQALSIAAPLTIRRRGQEARLIVGGAVPEIDATLLRNVAIGRFWFGEIRAGATIDALAKREGLSRARILQLVDLAFLSPALVEAIAEGRQPPSLTSSQLAKIDVPVEWSRQASLLADPR